MMDNDKVVPLNTGSQAGQASRTAASEEAHAAGLGVPVPWPPVTRLADDFGDPHTLFNSRDWLQKALEAKGAKIIGGGLGGGCADLDFVLDGCKFNVTICPR
jgi:hypothetical protein